jgi:hypothetical protein
VLSARPRVDSASVSGDVMVDIASESFVEATAPEVFLSPMSSAVAIWVAVALVLGIDRDWDAEVRSALSDGAVWVMLGVYDDGGNIVAGLCVRGSV